MSDLSRAWKKIEKQFKRWDKDLGQILGVYPPDLPEPPPIPPPEPPIGIPETGGGEVTKRRRLILGGRGRTILAGQLTPSKLGKRILG